MSLSIIGAGFGRTGTLSIKTALEILGFGPCYHMIEVFTHPAHAAAWQAAANGNADWDSLLADYRASVDWPGCYFWRELAQHYPEAKVLLSARDPQRWYQSVCDTIYPTLTRPPSPTGPGTPEQRTMAVNIILERTFHGRFEDREYAISVYERHNAEVRETIPPQRLLELSASQGWEPLCRFLERPVPQQPFPNMNSTSEFRALFVGRATPT